MLKQGSSFRLRLFGVETEIGRIHLKQGCAANPRSNEPLGRRDSIRIYLRVKCHRILNQHFHILAWHGDYFARNFCFKKLLCGEALKLCEEPDNRPHTPKGAECRAAVCA